MKHQAFIHPLFTLLLPGVALWLGSGCTNEVWVADQPDSDELAEVSFFTSTQTRAETSSPLTKSANVRVYVYHNKTGEASTLVDPKNYVTSSDGTKLESVPPVGTTDATSMFLPSGSFNFYAVSTNRTPAADGSDNDLIIVPTFDTTAKDGKPVVNQNNKGDDGNKGVAVNLKNGIDYLHAKQEGQGISFGTANQSVTLSFQHVTTQVQLTIKFSQTACAESEQAAQNFANARVFIQQTDVTDAYMRLYDGMIRFGNNTATDPLDCVVNTYTDTGNPTLDDTKMLAMTVDTETGLTSNGAIPANQVASCCMMPLKAASGQNMWIKVVIDNLQVGSLAPSTHTYTGKLNASNGWLAGKSNRYTLTLSGTEISFSDVSVTNWEEGGSGGEVGDLEDIGANAGTN